MTEFEMVRTYLVLDTSSQSMLRWKTTNQQRQMVAGDEAGSLTGRYFMVMLKRKQCLIHRAVWMLKHNRPVPADLVIDHKDGNRYNNHPDNLQAITQQHNVRKGRLCDSALGFSWHNKRQCWRVRIRVPGLSYQKDLGNYKCMLDARAAYLRACREVYYGTRS